MKCYGFVDILRILYIGDVIRTNHADPSFETVIRASPSTRSFEAMPRQKLGGAAPLARRSALALFECQIRMTDLNDEIRMIVLEYTKCTKYT